MSNNEWGGSNFRPVWKVTLFDVIKDFSPSLKQAMYAAANKGIIHRGTWNHCALNAAGKELEIAGISSIKAAAEAFGVSPAIATKFINIWDARSGTDEQCTEYLKEQILAVGLFTEAGTVLPKIIRKRVFVGAEKIQMEEFEKAMENDEVFGTELVGILVSA